MVDVGLAIHPVTLIGPLPIQTPELTCQRFVRFKVLRYAKLYL